MRKLTQAETEALKTIAAECHEELRRGTPMKNAAWQCVNCKKHIPFTVTCKALPKGIPAEIKSGKATCKDRETKQSTP